MTVEFLSLIIGSERKIWGSKMLLAVILSLSFSTTLFNNQFSNPNFSQNDPKAKTDLKKKRFSRCKCAQSQAINNPNPVIMSKIQLLEINFLASSINFISGSKYSERSCTFRYYQLHCAVNEITVYWLWKLVENLFPLRSRNQKKAIGWHIAI